MALAPTEVAGARGRLDSLGVDRYLPVILMILNQRLLISSRRVTFLIFANVL